MRGANRGFTLLEVLAAVALLGVLYTVLARVATQGLRAEGESRRRLEASLIADQELSRIESGLNEWTAPKVGRSKTESDPFEIHQNVTDYWPPFQPDDDSEPRPSDKPLPTLFPAPNTRAPSAVRKIVIRVVWFEGAYEREVVRTTFGFDAASAAAKLFAAQGSPL
ncbi:MAG: type II secretion system protein [Myxococcales bacterium]|nr:type II secretion system protein [Myxococcales bacterium]